MDIQSVIRLISQIPIFSNLDPEDTEALAKVFRKETYPENSIVYRQGDTGATMYVMDEGRGLLLKAEEESHEKKVGTVKPGDVVGTRSIFIEDERDVTFMTIRPSVLYSLTLENFKAVANEHVSIRPSLNFDGRPDLAPLNQVKTFRWLLPGENALLYARRHKWAFQRKATFVIVLMVLALAAHAPLWVAQMWCLALPALLVILTLAGVAFLFIWADWQNDYFVVTNQRVVHEERVFAFLGEQTIKQAPLDKVQNVTVDQEGLAAKIFDFSNLRIETAGPEGTIMFDMVSDAEDYRELILTVHRRYESRSAAERRADIRRQIEARLGTDLQRRGAIAVEGIGLDEEDADAEHGEYDEEAPPDDAAPPAPNLAQRLGKYWSAVKESAVDYLTPRIRTESGGTVTFRKHWIVLFQVIWQPIFVMSLMFVLTVTRLLGIWPPLLLPLERVMSPTGTIVGFVVFMVPGVVWLWWSFEDWRRDIYQITPDSVVDLKDKPWFFGERREVQAPISQVQTVTSEKTGWFGRLFNLGKVIIRTAGADGVLEWVYVYDPEMVAEEVSRCQRAFSMETTEEKEVEQADLLAEWFAIYHQSMHPEEAYGGEEGELYSVRRRKDLQDVIDELEADEDDDEEGDEFDAPEMPPYYERL